MKSSLINKNIIALLGAEGLPLESRKELLEEMVTLVETRVLNRILSLLNEEDKKIMHEVLETGDEDKINQFFIDRDIDLFKISDEEITKTKRELIQELK